MDPTLTNRIVSYLDACQPAISGQGGHDQTFKVACAIVKGFGLSTTEALMMINRHYNDRCIPPWSESELTHKVEEADAISDDKPRGWLRPSKAEDYEDGRKPVPYKASNLVVPAFDLEALKQRRLAIMGSERLSLLQDWPLEKIIASSPKPLPEENNAEENFQTFLSLWEPNDVIWMGHVEDSGHEGARSMFAMPSIWEMRGVPAENKLWTSGCTYKPGSVSRSKENIVSHKYAIVESDKLPYEKQGAILLWLRGLGLKLRMVVDTRGASLHGWVDITGLDAAYIKRMTTLLCGIHDGLEPNPNDPGKMRRKFFGGMGCDPATFRGSQPSRLPGATRPSDPQRGKRGGIQRIVYMA